VPRPFVGVLIDTYNHERIIEQAIVSAFDQDFPRQTGKNIVLDDGSTDRTPEIRCTGICWMNSKSSRESRSG
jgi:glycosyltransferase involved in cell wall biosynthesis